MSITVDTSGMLGTREAAEMVGRCQDVVKWAVREGRLPGERVDGSWRVRPEDVIAWDATARRLRRRTKPHPYDQVAEMLTDYGSMTPNELAELLMVHPGNARKHLAILANQRRAHRHHDGEWFPGPSCPGCLEEAAS